MGKEYRNLSKVLGKLELAIMDIVWKSSSANVREVLTELNKGKRKLAYTTVMTVMHRLTEKGWLVANKKGRAFSYKAVFSPQETEAAAVAKIVHSLVHDHGDLAIAQFMKEVGEITPEQLTKLASLARRKGNDKDD